MLDGMSSALDLQEWGSRGFDLALRLTLDSSTNVGGVRGLGGFSLRTGVKSCYEIEEVSIYMRQ